MELRIKSISLKNFKGVKDKTISFDGESAKIIGQNGAGKTSIADAFFWAFADCNTGLVKNPVITPIGMEECETQVEMELAIDGKPLSIAKSQKYKSKEVDGKITSSITNTYEINSITKSYKDFVADLTSRGIDMDNFIIYSNPNAFLSDTSKAGREKIRKILFEMAADISDEEIAEEVGADSVIKAMNENGYSLEEIKASAKATIKKITDRNGKDNELINARIDGMLSSKYEGDINILNSQKAEYEAELERIEKELHSTKSNKFEINSQMLNLMHQAENIKDEANRKLEEARFDFKKAVSEMSQRVQEYKFQLNNLDDEIERSESILKEAESDLEVHRKMYKEEQDRVMDDKELICPVCKQEYPEDQAEKIKADFIENKAKRLETIESTGKKLKAKIEANRTVIEGYKEKKEQYESTLKEVETNYEEARAKLDKIPSEVDMSNNEEYVEITNKIDALNKELVKPDDERQEELRSQKNMNTQMLDKVIGEIALVKKNEEIEKSVAELRERRKADEIAKANAEKTLSQVEDVEMAKNEKLSESINEKFELVDWHLWDRQKNGSLIEVTEPYIDGKPMSSCANGSLITLAKLSVCEALQKVREQRIPIWCDDASLMSSNTKERIKLDTQYIQLIVADGAKEIEIERG